MNQGKTLYATHSDQIKIYFETFVRNFRNEKRWGLLVSAIIIPFLITLVTGDDLFQIESSWGMSFWSQNTSTGVFALICACLWLGLFNSCQKICKERSSIDAEYRSGQSMGAYLVAQMWFESILCLFETIILSAIVIFKYAGNTSFIRWIGIVITFFLAIYAADMLGLFISAISKTAEKSMTFMPFILIVQLVFAGVIFNLTWITDIISKFTISRWGYKAIMNIIGDSDATSFILCWICMLLIIAVCGIATHKALKFIHYDQR